MQICGNDRFGLDIQEVFPSIGFYSEGEVGVWIDIPEKFPKQ